MSQEESGFRALYEREFPFVWRSLRRLGVADADLPDATHDVFSVVVRRWSDYDPKRSLRGWIFGITRLVAASTRRRIRTRAETDEPYPPATAPSPENAVADRELLLILLDGLDDDRRQAFILHDLEGFSGPEISESLGIPVNTVYSRVRSAREQLAARVERMKLRRAI